MTQPQFRRLSDALFDMEFRRKVDQGNLKEAALLAIAQSHRNPGSRVSTFGRQHYALSPTQACEIRRQYRENFRSFATPKYKWKRRGQVAAIGLAATGMVGFFRYLVENSPDVEKKSINLEFQQRPIQVDTAFRESLKETNVTEPLVEAPAKCAQGMLYRTAKQLIYVVGPTVEADISSNAGFSHTCEGRTLELTNGYFDNRKGYTNAANSNTRLFGNN